MFGSKFHPLRVMSGAAGLDIYNGGGKGGDAPAAPDYTALAQQQAQMQRDINRETLAANRVNQATPYGSVQYTQSGTDQYGNPTYTATQTLSPEQQKLYNQNTALSSGMLTGAQSGLANYANVMANPTVDQSKLAQTGINPGETYSDAIMRRLQPQMAQDKEMFDAQMANQGIAPGTQAYENAARVFQQGQNDKLTSAVVGGMQTGLAANQQGFNQAAYNLTSPVNMINSLRSGNQVQNPNYVSPAQAQGYSAPNLMGAAQQQYQSAMDAYNAQQASSGGFFGGLMNLGGTVLGASSKPWWMA